MLPQGEIEVRNGDQILLCGRREARDRMDWTLQDLNTLRYLVAGDDNPEGWFWRWMARRRGSQPAEGRCDGASWRDRVD